MWPLAALVLWLISPATALAQGSPTVQEVVPKAPVGSVALDLEGPAWRRYLWPALVTCLIVGAEGAIIGALLLQRRQRRRVEVALRESEEDARAGYEEARDLARRLIHARETERKRIARDLHDDIGQRVASLSIALSRIKRRIPDSASPTRGDLADLEQQTRRLSADLRRLSHGLHPSALEHVGLLEALRGRCDDFTQDTGVAVRFDVSDAWQEVPNATAYCLYRVVQESLRNVAEHARARNVSVSLDRQNGHVMVRVTDDGCGFDTTAVSHRSSLGLVSLGERVRMLDGALEVAAKPGAGTCVTVRLPAGRSHAA